MAQKITLKAARVNASLTIRQAAEALNVSEKTVMNWESGETIMNAVTFMKVCELYHFNPSDIFLPEPLTESKA